MIYKAIVFLPLLGALIAGLLGRVLGPRPCEIITTSFVGAAAVLSWIAFWQVGIGGETLRVPVLRWVTSGELDVSWALRIDTLTAVMLVVVNTVSALVHLYSIGYMHEDDSRPRFFAYLSLFTFAMLALVTADNFVQLFFGWEGVGLASYLLIGFWYHKPAANAAAIKAFVVNRVGDFGFALGIFGIFAVFGTIGFDAVFRAAPGVAGKPMEFLGHQWDTLTVLCLLLFMGAMGKSAQFLLHTWLPGRHGGPDAGLGADPCRHHGDGRRVHGGAAVAAVRAGAGGAAGRDAGRRRHRLLRRHRRPGAERHQARHRLFDLLAARLHVRRPAASAPTAPASSTSSRTPSSRRCCSSAPAR